MGKLLALLLVCAIQCHAQVTLTTGPNIVVTLSSTTSTFAVFTSYTFKVSPN